MDFLTVLPNVAVMLVYMAIGFILCKARKITIIRNREAIQEKKEALKEKQEGNSTYKEVGAKLIQKEPVVHIEHCKTMSAVMIYALAPCMIINAFLNMEYSETTIAEIGKFFLTTLLLQLVFFIILFLIFRKKFKVAKYRIMTIASILGNVGFFGMPLVQALFPNNPIVSCYSSIFMLSMNLIVFTVGVFALTNDKKYISIKSAILNPTTIAIVIALPLYIFKVQFPTYVRTPIAILGNSATPICMIILGMRLASSNLKKLFTRPFIYVTCLLKLIIFPLFAYAVVYFIPFFDSTFKVCIFALCAAPSGAIISTLAELHGSEQELSANVVLMSTVLSIITVPLLMLIVH